MDSVTAVATPIQEEEEPEVVDLTIDPFVLQESGQNQENEGEQPSQQ
jgi:hypothetical protein